MPIDIPPGLQSLTAAPGADLPQPYTVSARMADPTGAQEWTYIAPPQGSIWVYADGDTPTAIAFVQVEGGTRQPIPMNTVVSFEVEDFGDGILYAFGSGTNPTFSLFWGSK